MKRATFAVAATVAVAAGASWAAGPAAVRKQVEASLVVTGKIRVDETGKVSGYTLDEQEKLPVAVVGIIARRVPLWRFEPVLLNGAPAHVSTDMSVRLVAKKADKDNYIVSVRSAAFGDESDKDSRAARVQEALKAEREGETAGRVCKTGLTPPDYPLVAAQAGVAANVYLLLKTDAGGQVQDLMAEQVNLKVVADDRVMERWRQIFADAAIRQGRKWCVEPPREGLAGPTDFQVVRVPVVFTLERPARYGQWEAYVPGPRQPSPWQGLAEGLGFSPDALMPGRAYRAGTGLKLLTDIGADS